MTLLKDLIDARSIPNDGFIFLTEEGNHISRSVYNKTWKQALAEVGLNGVRPYDLRASNISWMHAGGPTYPPSWPGLATSASTRRGATPRPSPTPISALRRR